MTATAGLNGERRTGAELRAIMSVYRLQIAVWTKISSHPQPLTSAATLKPI